MIVVRNAVPIEVCNHIAATLLIKEFSGALVEDKHQVVGSNIAYGAPSCEALLLSLHSTMEKETGLKLIPTYSFARIYRQGDALAKHTDRPACEISATLTLWYTGINKWLVYGDGEGVDLKAGDMLIYQGCDMEHWREPLDKGVWVQLFLHYVNAEGEHKDQAFDGRKDLADLYATLKEFCFDAGDLQKV